MSRSLSVRVPKPFRLRALARWLARAGCVLALAPLGCGAATAVEAGAVVASSGDTRLVRGGSIATPLRQGTVVYSGDRLVTGPRSRLELRFADDARIAIGPSSEFRVDEYYFEPAQQRSFFTLARGVIRQVSGAIGKRNHDDYRLTTPTGVLAIRGTEFIAKERQCPKAGCAEADEYPGLSVTVLEGRVVVANAAGNAEVPAGSAVRLDDASTPPVFTAGPRAQGTFPRQTLRAQSASLAGDDAFRIVPAAAAGPGAGSGSGAGGPSAPGEAGAAGSGSAAGAGRAGATAEPPVVPRIP
ncbi:MAG: FecR family protein [Burkholderiaceae bacterium]